VYYVERHPYRSDFLSRAPWPRRLGLFAFHLAPSSSRLNWTTGTFSKWPMRIVGISPRFAAAYAASFDSPNRVVQTGLRIRVSLRDRLEKEAKLHGISLNSEMERRLEASFEPTIRRDEFMGYVRRLAKEDEAREKAETSLALSTAAQKQKEQK